MLLPQVMVLEVEVVAEELLLPLAVVMDALDIASWFGLGDAS